MRSRPVIGALLLALTVALQMTQLLTALLGLVMLVAPTYLVVWPLLRQRLGVAAAFTVAGGLSIGLVVIGGLLLNLSPWGLLRPSWLVGGIAALAIAVAVRRRSVMAWRPVAALARGELLLVAVGTSLMVAALLVARAADSQPPESFTQLSVLSVADAATPSIKLTVRSEEQGSTGYRLQLLCDGLEVGIWTDIELATDGTWSTVAKVAPGRIEARLFLVADGATVYRHVTMLLSGSDAAAVIDGRP